VYKLVVRTKEGKSHLEDPDVDGRIILKWIFRKWDIREWIGSICLRIGQVESTCECNNKPSVSIKCGKFLD
jgi:hypothetical protein